MLSGSPGLKSRGGAIVLMILGAVAISLGGLIVRSLMTNDAAIINFYRSVALVGTTSLIIALWQRDGFFKQIVGIGLNGLVAGVLLGCAGITFLMALLHTTVANTVLVTSSTPLLSAILAYLFLGERLSRSTLIAIATAFTGVSIMVVSGLGTALSFGNFMAVATAVGYAIYAVALRSGRDRDMMPTIIVAGLVVLIFSLFQSGGDLAISKKDLLLCLIWGGLFSATAHWFLVIASKQLAAAELSLFMLLEVALAPLWVWIFVSETPSATTFFGGSLIFVGLLISIWREANSRDGLTGVKNQASTALDRFA